MIPTSSSHSYYALCEEEKKLLFKLKKKISRDFPSVCPHNFFSSPFRVKQTSSSFVFKPLKWLLRMKNFHFLFLISMAKKKFKIFETRKKEITIMYDHKKNCLFREKIIYNYTNKVNRQSSKGIL